MTKNVLVLSGSFRKNGNSDLLCNQFIKGASESENNVEKIFINDYKINFCKGCGVCNNTHKCIQKDDMEEILDKMIKADVIVMATPIYFYTMNGQMKTLIDRTVPRYEEISNKEFYFLMTAAEDDRGAMERAIEEFRGYMACLNGPQEKGIIYGIGAWQSGDIKTQPAMQEAYEMGKTV